MVENNKEKTISKERRKKISDGMKGHIVSDKTKRKISRTMKKWWKNKMEK